MKKGSRQTFSVSVLVDDINSAVNDPAVSEPSLITDSSAYKQSLRGNSTPSKMMNAYSLIFIIFFCPVDRLPQTLTSVSPLWSSPKKGKISVIDTFCDVCVWRLGSEWGLNAPAHLSASILWPCFTCYQTSSSYREVNIKVSECLCTTCATKNEKYSSKDYLPKISKVT